MEEAEAVGIRIFQVVAERPRAQKTAAAAAQLRMVLGKGQCRGAEAVVAVAEKTMTGHPGELPAVAAAVLEKTHQRAERGRLVG